MVLTFLSDFGTRATDLWKGSKFEFNKTLEVNVDKDNSISWTGNHVLKGSDRPDSKVTLKQKEAGLGTLEVEWAVPVKNSQPKLTMTTPELGIDEVEICIEGADRGNLTAIYGAEKWAAKCNAQYADSKMVLDSQASFAYDKVTFGLQGVLDMKNSELESYNVGVRLDQDSDRTYSLTSKDKFNKLLVAFYYKVSNEAEIGTQIDVDMAKGKIDINAGGSYCLDDASKVRYALNSNADLSLAYEYNFSDKIQGFVGTQYSLTQNALSGPVGYKLCFNC